MTSIRVGNTVAWLPWTHAAFQRARDEQKPVLLSLHVPWSAACREMDRESYADPAIVDEINRWFIPIRVDADRRPDIAERYELGGLPTTAFLNEDGDVLGGGTFVPAGRMRDALAQARHARVSPDPSRLWLPPSGGSSLTDEQLVAMVFESFDSEHAGFGEAPKFPLIAPVRLALAMFQEAEAETIGAYAARTLDAMGWGGLYDSEHGGFFHCASRSDWQEPQPGKLLVTNAALLKLYLEAGRAFANERWLARAADILEFIQSQLALAPGAGWRTSTDSDSCLCDANAAMVSAALVAADAFDDASLRQLALDALETVLLDSYRPGAGVAHCRGGVKGLLTDHVAMASAHLDAWDVTGNDVYRMMAQELVEFMRRALLDGDVFVDRVVAADDVGRLTQPLTPYVANCDAVEVLQRLTRATEDPQYAGLAARVVDSMHPRAAAHGPLAAHYLLARRSLSR